MKKKSINNTYFWVFSYLLKYWFRLYFNFYTGKTGLLFCVPFFLQLLGQKRTKFLYIQYQVFQHCARVTQNHIFTEFSGLEGTTGGLDQPHLVQHSREILNMVEYFIIYSHKWVYTCLPYSGEINYSPDYINYFWFTLFCISWKPRHPSHTLLSTL